MTWNREVVDFVKAALECSVYLAPREPGLTRDELHEIGSRLGLQAGEIDDATPYACMQLHSADGRLRPDVMHGGQDFLWREEPDYRNLNAFDFVVTQLKALVRSQGAARASFERTVLVGRAVAAGLPERDVEAAITIMLFAEHLTAKDGTLRFVPGREQYPSPIEQRQQSTGGRFDEPIPRPMRAKVYPVVRDVVARRDDGRARSAEPFDAFSEELDKLKFGEFRLWWKQSVAELRQLEPTTTPVAVAVQAAALVEGALTLVVRHARALGLPVFQSKDFEGSPRTWKIDDLVKSAASGGPAAILDASARHRADELVKVRQRIHAGRMLAEYPQGVPDLRPEEARDAKATAELVVRRILDWLTRNPPQL